MNYIELGPVPAGEECAQAGADNYEETARRECLVFRRMLSRLFPVPDGLDARYVTRRYPHELGPYFEVCVRYSALCANGRSDQAADFAYAVERDAPVNWDAIATYELAWFAKRDAYSKAVRAGELTQADVPQHYQGSEPSQLPAGSKPLAELLPANPG